VETVRKAATASIHELPRETVRKVSVNPEARPCEHPKRDKGASFRRHEPSKRWRRVTLLTPFRTVSEQALSETYATAGFLYFRVSYYVSSS
jgi:hypothetical protein